MESPKLSGLRSSDYQEITLRQTRRYIDRKLAGMNIDYNLAIVKFLRDRGCEEEAGDVLEAIREQVIESGEQLRDEEEAPMTEDEAMIIAGDLKRPVSVDRDQPFQRYRFAEPRRMRDPEQLTLPLKDGEDNTR